MVNSETYFRHRYVPKQACLSQVDTACINREVLIAIRVLGCMSRIVLRERQASVHTIPVVQRGCVLCEVARLDKSLVSLAMPRQGLNGTS